MKILETMIYKVKYKVLFKLKDKLIKKKSNKKIPFINEEKRFTSFKEFKGNFILIRKLRILK